MPTIQENGTLINPIDSLVESMRLNSDPWPAISLALRELGYCENTLALIARLTHHAPYEEAIRLQLHEMNGPED